MSDIKLFRITDGHAKEIQGTASYLEKPLQVLIESDLDKAKPLILKAYEGGEYGV